jgi:S-DNA-T family DNA segregation ATPase FtsK/SpoIIIE
VTVPAEQPVPPGDGRWSRVVFLGDDEARRTFAHTVLARLAASCPAGSLLVVPCVAPARRADWAWTRWLPHTLSPREGVDDQAEVLGPHLAGRPPFVPGARADRAEPLVVVVLDGADLPAGEYGPAGLRNTVVLDLNGRRHRPGRTTLRVDVTARGALATWADEDRTERSAPLADAATAARLLAVGTRPAEPGTVGYRLTRALDDPEAGHPWLWPQPPETAPAIDHLLPPLVPTPDRGLSAATPPDGAPLTVPVGVVDRPFERLADVLRVDASGHVLVLGGTAGGKSTLVTTLVVALALTRTPDEARFYCLDGGDALGVLSGLPHVGAVAGPGAPDVAEAIVAKVAGLLDQRAPGESRGDVFLVVDGEEYVGHHAALDRVAADGPARGVHLIVTAGERPGLATTGTWSELCLDGPAGAPGRGHVDGAPFLTAVPRVDGVDGAEGLTGAVSALVEEVAEHWGTRPGAPGVCPLPAIVSADDLPGPQSRLEVVLGLADDGPVPIRHDFATAPHLVVFGEPGSGRTNLLRLVARSITATHSPGEARILAVDYRGGLLHALPEDYVLGHAFSAGVLGELIDGTARAIGERAPVPGAGPRAWHGPRLFILIDDYEQVRDPEDALFAPLLDHLTLGYEVGAHLVVARSCAGAGEADPLLRALYDAGAGTLSLSCPPDEGGILDGVEPRELPPGRGHYRANGETTLMQTALAD